jgi:hypothetical protein
VIPRSASEEECCNQKHKKAIPDRVYERGSKVSLICRYREEYDRVDKECLAVTPSCEPWEERCLPQADYRPPSDDTRDPKFMNRSPMRHWY